MEMVSLEILLDGIFNISFSATDPLLTRVWTAGRDDYLIWDKDGGLTGYLNIRSATEGKPTWISQGPSKSIALGLGTSWELIRLADIYGTGKVDYCILNAKTGAVEVYANHGSADTSVTGDGVRFAGKLSLFEVLCPPQMVVASIFAEIEFHHYDRISTGTFFRS